VKYLIFKDKTVDLMGKTTLQVASCHFLLKSCWNIYVAIRTFIQSQSRASKNLLMKNGKQFRFLACLSALPPKTWRKTKGQETRLFIKIAQA